MTQARSNLNSLTINLEQKEAHHNDTKKRNLSGFAQVLLYY